MFCVECGSEENVIGHLCSKCLMSKNLITPPEYVSVELCQGCFKVLDGSIWRDMRLEDAAASVLEKGTKTYKEVKDLAWDVPDFPDDKGEHRVPCRGRFSIAGQIMHMDFEIGIRVRYQKCPSCSRQSGDYYEAIIQLRQDGVTMKTAESELATESQALFRIVDDHADSDENAFVTKCSVVKGGIDFYLGSTALARTIANKFRLRFGAMVSESPSLIGQKDGQDLYRYSILVRLPTFREGDVVSIDGKLHVVESNDGKAVSLKSVQNGQIARLGADSPKLRMVAKHNELLQAVVVTHDRNTIQILDPSSMAAVTVLKPPYMKHVGETVPVVRHDEILHVV